ncbi:NADP-dependent oxidoreductase [Streptomyces sp. NPDC047002]|uniref:MDR family NADP-dependent oxidoreductase n=1 Tax=Streptomyces sp. NPDC047002 TaxID=3155475 RepID=UPI00345592FB
MAPEPRAASGTCPAARALPPDYREVRLAARPGAALRPEHFTITTAPLRPPEQGEVLVRNLALRVGAATRTLMAGGQALPMEPYRPGAVLRGSALGEVVAATGTPLRPGDLVRHDHGWQQYALLEAGRVRPVDPGAWPDPAACLSQGFAGWLAVERVGRARPGETVLVTGAAGGVGCVAGQFARLCGAGRLIGTTGAHWKADVLRRQLGFDAVLVRGDGPIGDQLRAAAPDGVDLVVDTVGGDQFEAAAAQARRHARIVVVGALSGQAGGGTGATARVDTLSLCSRAVTVTGLTATDHQASAAQWEAEFSAGLRAGTLAFPHVRLKGIDRAPGALMDLLAGRHLGTVLVEPT